MSSVGRTSSLLLFVISMVLFVVTAEVACAEEIVLQLWDGITGPDREGLDRIIAEFNEANAGRIKVERTPMPWGEFYEKLALATASDVAPDLAILHRDRLPEQVLAGTIRPIDRLFAAFDFSDDDWLAGLADGGKYQGKRYGIPLDVHPLLLYYDADAVAQAGLSGAPVNSKEFLEYARKLTIRRGEGLEQTRWGTRFGIWGPQYLTLLRQMGGDYFAGPNDDQVIIDNEAGRRALAYVHDLMYEHQVAPPPQFWPDMFKGQVALVVDGIWFLRQAQQERDSGGVNFQVARADAVYGDVRKAVWAGSHMFVLPSRQAVNEQRARAAMEFIDFFGRHSVVWAHYGQLPARRAAVGSDEFAALTDHQIIAHQQFTFFAHQPWGTGGGKIEEFLWPALTNEMSIGAALEEGGRKLKAYIREMKEKLDL